MRIPWLSARTNNGFGCCGDVNGDDGDGEADSDGDDDGDGDGDGDDDGDDDDDGGDGDVDGDWFWTWWVQTAKFCLKDITAFGEENWEMIFLNWW